jgi:two-component system, chemotaxis family, chemotaxis protein CheY
MRFLIVDDAEASLKCLQRMLEALGHEVAGTARNGVDAVEAYRRLLPDVVILDVIMPRMNGLDALRAIRALDPRARVVLASTLQSCRTALEGERLGALYCLAKPYDECKLRKVLDEIGRTCGKAAASGAAGPRYSAAGPSL